MCSTNTSVSSETLSLSKTGFRRCPALDYIYYIQTDVADICGTFGSCSPFDDLPNLGIQGAMGLQSHLFRSGSSCTEQHQKFLQTERCLKLVGNQYLHFCIAFGGPLNKPGFGSESNR